MVRYTGEYVGKSVCGFEKSKTYSIDVNKTLYGYEVAAVRNHTDDLDSKAFIVYASENSLMRNWIIEGM